jgi:polyphosphate:AMP phosphotransferase
LIKLWCHVSKDQQKKRLRELERARATRWRVGKNELEQQRRYAAFRRVSEVAVRETSTGLAPWTVIEAGDDRFRDVSVARQLLAQLEARLDRPARSEPPRAPHSPIADPTTILDTLDLGARIDEQEYDEKMPRLQGRLNELARKLARKEKSAIIVFEGPDAAGKGGAIRRLTRALDVRQFRVIPIAAPTEEERAHHYLWRFWRHLPRRGRFTIYDRSWYGRVLVERVEGFATDEQWLRAYEEIDDFEQELALGGVVLVKFWIHISSDEQLRRFKARELEPWKQHKISAEDYRNRLKANLYEVAASEMIARCSTEYAPFSLIPGDDKHVARLRVLETVCERLEDAL